MFHCDSWRYLQLFDFAERKMRFAALSGLCILLAPTQRWLAVGHLLRQVRHLNLTHCGNTKSSMRRDGSDMRTSI
jgi:hypothetical protein